MKKKNNLLLIISSLLLLSSCNILNGTRTSNNGSNNNISDSNNESNSVGNGERNSNDGNEDSPFTKLINSLNYSLNYTGSFKTIKENRYINFYDNTETNHSFVESISFDKENKIGYYNMKNDDLSEVLLKVFNKDNTYYCLKRNINNGLENDEVFTNGNFYQKHSDYVLIEVNDFYTKNILSMYLKGLHLASSLDEVKNAYNSVLTTSISNTKKFASINDEDLFYVDGKVDSNITLEENNDIISLTIEYTLDLTESENEECKYTYFANVKAYDSKIIELSASVEEIYDDNDKSFEEVTYYFEYSFDQDGYNDIENPAIIESEVISTEVPSQYDSSTYLYKKFITENITHNDEYINLDNLNNIGDKLFEHLKHEYYDAGNIIGVYKDKEHTQLINNANFTLEDLMNITNIYADVVVKPEYAVTRARYTYIDLLSKDFKIVLGDNWMNQREGSSTMSTCYLLSKKSTLDIYMEKHLKPNEDYFIKVNGNEFENDTINLKSGTEYYIEYFSNVRDSIISLDLLFEALIESVDLY